MSPTNGTTNGHSTGASSAYDADLDVLYNWMPPQAAPAVLPEAAFSLTLRGLMGGQDAMLTVRAMTAAEFRRNIDAVRGLLDAPARPPAAPVADTTPQCPQHGAMKASSKGRGWYCPTRLDDGSWCQHKSKAK